MTASAYTITKRLRRLPRLATRATDTRDTTPPDSANARRPAPGPRLPPGAAAVLDQLDEGREHPHLLARLVRCVRAVTEQAEPDTLPKLDDKPTWAATAGWLLDAAPQWNRDPWCAEWLDHETARIQRELADRITTQTGRCAYCDTHLENHHIGPMNAGICPRCDRVAHMQLTCSPDKADQWARNQTLDKARELLGLTTGQDDEPKPPPMLGPAVAQHLGLSWHTIRSWESRGQLTHAGHDHKGRKTYDPETVRQVAERKRHAA